MWQIWQFFMAKFANFCGKIWQNLGFQMAIFCDARLCYPVLSPIDYSAGYFPLDFLLVSLKIPLAVFQIFSSTRATLSNEAGGWSTAFKPIEVDNFAKHTGLKEDVTESSRPTDYFDFFFVPKKHHSHNGANQHLP